MTENIIPFVSATDKLIALAEANLEGVKVDVTRGTNMFILNDTFIRNYIDMEVRAKDKEFSLREVLKIILIKTLDAVKQSSWSRMFLARASSMRTEDETKRRTEQANERGKIRRQTYAECKKGEYSSYDKDGYPQGTVLNAELVFRELGIIASFNEFTEKQEFLLKGEEVHLSRVRSLMHDLVQTDFSKRTVEEAKISYCLRFPYHPIKQYFESIRHLDPSKGLIDNWLTVTVGAADIPLHCEIGKKMLVAMVARIYEPGKKFDNMIVLESKLQGHGKSTLLEILSTTQYFNSGNILTMSSKEQMEHLKGRMIYESGELVGHGRVDIDNIKAFLSATHDRGRWAYATDVRDHPRTAIIVGTTNRDNYLLDDTGNRRIWPVACCAVPTDTVHDGVPCPTEANLEWLRDNRDQLFREALALYESGYSLVLDRKYWGDVQEVQSSRMADVPFTDNVAGILGLTENEGLVVKDDPVNHILELRIHSQSIIEGCFPPSFSANTIVGRLVKNAMKVKIIGDLQWEHYKNLRVGPGSVNLPGYVLRSKDEATYKLLREEINAHIEHRRRRGVSSPVATL